MLGSQLIYNIEGAPESINAFWISFVVNYILEIWQATQKCKLTWQFGKVYQKVHMGYTFVEHAIHFDVSGFIFLRISTQTIWTTHPQKWITTVLHKNMIIDFFVTMTKQCAFCSPYISNQFILLSTMTLNTFRTIHVHFYKRITRVAIAIREIMWSKCQGRYVIKPTNSLD